MRHTQVPPFESARRPIVGFACDYGSGTSSGFHNHARAQLLYAISGVMRVETMGSSFIIPPTTALFLPADAEHAVSMDGPVAMRELFLRKDAAAKIGTEPKVIAVSALLREVIVAACAEPMSGRPGAGGTTWRHWLWTRSRGPRRYRLHCHCPAIRDYAKLLPRFENDLTMLERLKSGGSWPMLRVERWRGNFA